MKEGIRVRERHTQDVHRLKLRQDGRNLLKKKKVEDMVENKGIWKDVVNKRNSDFEGGVKQMCVGIKGILGKA